eukprot:CAMPEP_0172717248 /NCGR_PEP_ID=MMETSP1074-20121228/70822_1 /TAXON_ID=2916 /ORGANISM="Ceratium fusus, Strain PA161109" /LENGTH=84 /DNA_ID=CAMNT_0013542141 /DNA_START=13 /DNA_END=267 /DNA_ORIENTATION=-
MAEVGTDGPEACATWLEERGLGQYAKYIVQEEGWDDLEVLLTLTTEELKSLADGAQMTPSNAIEFYMQICAAQATMAANKEGSG